MAVSLVGYTANAVDNGGSGTSISVPPPSGLAPGDLWVIMVQIDTTEGGSEGLNLPAGWSAVSDMFTTTDWYPIGRAFYKLAGPSETNVSITSSSGAFYIAHYVSCRVSGQHATPLDTANTKTNVYGTTIDAPDVTVAENGSLAFVWAFAASDGGTFTEPSGTSLITKRTGGWCISCYATKAVDAGSYAPSTFGLTSAASCCAQTFVIKPAAGGASSTPLFRRRMNILLRLCLSTFNLIGRCFK